MLVKMSQRLFLTRRNKWYLDVSGQTQSESSFAPIGEVVLSNLDKLNALQQHDGAITGVPTGFKDVDHVFNGLQKSDLILVAARPAMGKTAFTLNIAQNVTMVIRQDGSILLSRNGQGTARWSYSVLRGRCEL